MSPANVTPQFADLDPLLGPTLRNTVGSTRRVALAVLVRGFAAGHSRGLLTAWLKSRGDDDMRTLIARPWFPDLVRDARKALGQNPSPTGGARALVSHLFAPLPGRVTVSGRREVTARVLFAVIGLEVLDSMTNGVPVGTEKRYMKTALTTSGRLGVSTGMSAPTIRAAAHVIEDASWARVVRRVHRGPTRWALGTVPREKGKDVDALHDGLIRALAEGDATWVDQHPAAAIIRTVSHPAWSYGSEPLGYTPWLVLVASNAGVDPTTLGVARSGVKRSRQAIVSLLAGHDDLPSALDSHAQTTGAYIARDEAEAKRAAAAIESAKQRAQHKASLMPPEHVQVKVPGFDAALHGAGLVARVVAAKGPGWEIESVGSDGVVTLTRPAPAAA